MHGAVVDDLLKKKTLFAAHEYDTCIQGCRLYNVNDERSICDDCGSNRFDEDNRPVQKMKILSVGDIVSKLLSNQKTRDELSYRANYESTPDHVKDFFDGAIYQQFLNQEKFQNPDDVAAMLFTDAFVKDKRGLRLFNIVHLVILNYDKKTRYKQTYHIQLAITPGPSKSSMDTFLMPILAELHYLERNGMLVKKFGETICRAKVYLVINGGDIPAINLVSHVAPHQSFYPCRICVQRAEHPENRSHGMYLRRTDSELRTLHEYTHGDPDRGISGLSIFSSMDLHLGPLSYSLDEMHIISRGVGSLLLDMLNVDNTNSTKYYHKISRHLDEYERELYPFFIDKHTMADIGNAIEATRQYIPVKFEGSFLNIIKQTRGTRAVDLGDFLLYLVPTLIVPRLGTRDAQRAVLKLVRGCAISLKWDLSFDNLNEMDACFAEFFGFCNNKINQKQLSASVFKPVVHYLSHISYVCRNLGPLRVYSTRSQERAIGYFKNMITGTVKTQAQASNLIEKVAIRSFLYQSLDIVEEGNIIRPSTFDESSYLDNLDDENCTAQFWIPFQTVQLCNDTEEFEGVQISKFRKALSKYYRRKFSNERISIVDNIDFVLAGRVWFNDYTVITSIYYARINREFRRAGYYVFFDSPYLTSQSESCRKWFVGEVLFFFKHIFRNFTYFLAFVRVMKRNTTAFHDKSIPVVDKGSQNVPPKFAVISVTDDIKRQVGLIKFIGSRTKFSVIAPTYVFDADMSIDAGNIVNL